MRFTLHEWWHTLLNLRLLLGGDFLHLTMFVRKNLFSSKQMALQNVNFTKQWGMRVFVNSQSNHTLVDFQFVYFHGTRVVAVSYCAYYDGQKSFVTC